MFIPVYDHNPRVHIARQYVTYGLILANVAVFVLFQAGLDPRAGQQVALAFGAIPAVLANLRELAPGLAVVPEKATLLTYAFLHADWLHLFGNMLFLWVFGDNVEDALGHGRFLVFYLLCAAAGGLAYVAADPGSVVPVIGASGAVAGVVAAYLMLHPHVRVWVLVAGRIPLRLRALWILGAWVVWQVAHAAAGLQTPTEEGVAGIAWVTHVGGLLAGAVLVVPLRRRGVALFDRETPH